MRRQLDRRAVLLHLPCWLMLILLGATCGCQARATRPPNPVLEDAQEALSKVERRVLDGNEPTSAELLELGTARYRVWQIHLARSRYTGPRSHWSGKQAAKLQSKMIDAIEKAAASDDPHVSARAMVRLATVYGELQDWDQQIRLCWQILQRHGNLRYPALFGEPGTPHYYCYHTWSNASKRKDDRPEAIVAMAQALLALDQSEGDAAAIETMRRGQFRELLAYEPRIVLPQQQKLLPPGFEARPPRTDGPAPGLARLFERHRQTAPARVKLTVEHADASGILVAYEVTFPQYADIIRQWEIEQQQPRPPLPDDFGHLRPSFRLQFSTVPGSEAGFYHSRYAAEALAKHSLTPVLAFDSQCQARGRLILPWAEPSARPQELFLVADMVGLIRGVPGGSVVPADEIYAPPIAVTLPRKE